MMQTLRYEVLGKERFDRSFREYLRTWAYKHPTPADFFRLMRDVSGMDLDWFWRDWIYTTARLDQAVDSVATVDKEQKVFLSNRGSMTLPLEMDLTYDDGSTDRVTLPVEMWNLGPRFAYRVRSAKPVRKVTVDPRQALAGHRSLEQRLRQVVFAGGELSQGATQNDLRLDRRQVEVPDVVHDGLIRREFSIEHLGDSERHREMGGRHRLRRDRCRHPAFELDLFGAVGTPKERLDELIGAERSPRGRRGCIALAHTRRQRADGDQGTGTHGLFHRRGNADFPEETVQRLLDGQPRPQPAHELHGLNAISLSQGLKGPGELDFQTETSLRGEPPYSN